MAKKTSEKEQHEKICAIILVTSLIASPLITYFIFYKFLFGKDALLCTVFSSYLCLSNFWVIIFGILLFFALYGIGITAQEKQTFYKTHMHKIKR